MTFKNIGKGNDSSFYQGKSFKDNGLYRFTIESESMGKTLREINYNYDIEWLEPHHGNVSIAIINSK